MKIKTKRIIIALFTIAFVSIIFTSKVHAASNFQSRPDVSPLLNSNSSVYMEGIRYMEAEGGALGLNAQIDGSTYIDSTGNGVDVHMIKNTEWGATVMLMDSMYGSAVGNSDSSTNNSSGVYKLGDGTWEYVAGVVGNVNRNSNAANLDSRYYDLYNGSKTIRGDATDLAYKGRNTAVWPNSADQWNQFARGGGNIFNYQHVDGSYYYAQEGSYSYPSGNYLNGGGHRNLTIGSRAVISIGAGF